MKTFLTIVAFTILLNVTAQERNLQQKKHSFTPEQVAELQTKKMELNFELNAQQRKDLYQLNLQSAQKRQQNNAAMRAHKAENKTLTSDELYQKKIQRLDNQKKYQQEMKQILGEKQYLSWKETYQNKRMKEQKMNRNKKFAAKNSRNNFRLKNN